MRCTKCGEEWNHTEEDCYLNNHVHITDFPDLIDRTYDQVRDERMVKEAERCPIK